MTVFRRGSQRELSITVAELEPERTAARTTTPEPPKAQSSNVLQALGCEVVEFDCGRIVTSPPPSGVVAKPCSASHARRATSCVLPSDGVATVVPAS